MRPIEVTQADRQLLADLLGYDSEAIDDIMAGSIFTWEATQFARHRLAERAKVVAEIVADIRSRGSIVVQGEAVAVRQKARIFYNTLADTIEAKFGGGDD